tara:strand:+ start:126 stop:413 length:288 start_codon:yes stop_codon:yes gene_type:complete
MYRKATKRLGILINCNNRFSPIPETYPQGCGKLLWKTFNTFPQFLLYLWKTLMAIECVPVSKPHMKETLRRILASTLVPLALLAHEGNIKKLIFA